MSENRRSHRVIFWLTL